MEGLKSTVEISSDLLLVNVLILVALKFKVMASRAFQTNFLDYRVDGLVVLPFQLFVKSAKFVRQKTFQLCHHWCRSRRRTSYSGASKTRRSGDCRTLGKNGICNLSFRTFHQNQRTNRLGFQFWSQDEKGEIAKTLIRRYLYKYS